MKYKDVLKQTMKRRRKRERNLRKRQQTAVEGQRACNGCTACCEVVGVEELKKSYYEPCQHCNGQGCGSYGSRPQSCREFYCLYSDGLNVGRPDQCGVLYFVTGRRLGNFTLEIYETRKDAFLTEFRECLSTVNKLASRGILIPTILFVRFGVPVPTAWDGQNCKVKSVSFGEPRFCYSVRTECEAEDTRWWRELLEKVVQEEGEAGRRKEPIGVTPPYTSWPVARDEVECSKESF